MNASLVDTFKSTPTASILLAALVCALADILVKKTTLQGNLGEALRSPWLLIAMGLYVLQAYFFVIAFLAGSKLSIIGTLLTALYTLIVLAVGVLLYKESLTYPQIFGIALAIGGVILINSR